MISTFVMAATQNMKENKRKILIMWKETKYWICDICGKEYYPDSGGYNCYYTLNMIGNDSYASVRDVKEHQICCRCAEEICGTIAELR